MSGSRQPNQSDDSSGILWTIAAIFSALGIGWVVLKTQIIAFYFKLKLIEISIFGLFTNSLEPVRDLILSANPKQIKFHDLVTVGNMVGDYLRFPCILLVVILALIVFFTNSVREYKRVYSMKDFSELEVVNWPQISPVIGLDLVKTDLDKGPWAMAMTPMQFCKRNNLLEERKRQAQEGVARKDSNRIEVVLKRGQANKIFAMQLGPLWVSTAKLPMHTRALFAIFAARANNDSDVAAKLIMQLSASCKTKLNFTGIDELLKKYESSKPVQKIIQSHAYVLTVMASMLEGARNDGVQASADFLWLKPLDRRLWYTLNAVGRQTAFVEIAGIFAHWISEKTMGNKIIVPMVEEATNALDLALKDIIYRPDEE